MAHILYNDTHRQLIICGNRLFAETQIAVRESRIAQAFAKVKLRVESQITKRRVLSFEWLVIVIDQAVRCARVGEWKFAAGIYIAKQHVCDRSSTFVARVVSKQNCIRSAGNAVDNSRTAFDKDKYDWFAGGLQGFR